MNNVNMFPSGTVYECTKLPINAVHINRLPLRSNGTNKVKCSSEL